MLNNVQRGIVKTFRNIKSAITGRQDEGKRRNAHGRLFVASSLVFAMTIPALVSRSSSATSAHIAQFHWFACDAGGPQRGSNVYYGHQSGTYGGPIDVGNAMEHTMSLDPAIPEHFMAIRFYEFSTRNESAFSCEIKYTCNGTSCVGGVLRDERCACSAPPSVPPSAPPSAPRRLGLGSNL